MRFGGARGVIATLAAASAIGLSGGAVHADEGWNVFGGGGVSGGGGGGGGSW